MKLRCSGSHEVVVHIRYGLDKSIDTSLNKYMLRLLFFQCLRIKLCRRIIMVHSFNTSSRLLQRCQAVFYCWHSICSSSILRSLTTVGPHHLHEIDPWNTIQRWNWRQWSLCVALSSRSLTSHFCPNDLPLYPVIFPQLVFNRTPFCFLRCIQ